MTHTLPAPGSRRRGSGTQRERRPVVWKVRVPAGPDRVTGRRRKVSVTVHGTEHDADARRALLLTAEHRAGSGALTVGGLLEVWLRADHPWKPATVVSHRSVTRALRADRVALQPPAPPYLPSRLPARPLRSPAS